jgi:hypothetical protein
MARTTESFNGGFRVSNGGTAITPSNASGDVEKWMANAALLPSFTPRLFQPLGVRRTGELNEDRSIGYTISKNLLNVAAGNRGLVHNIQIILLGENVPTQVQNVLLKIYYDGNTDPDISVPLSSLIGYDTPIGGSPASAAFHSNLFSIVSTPAHYADSIALYLNYPIPFTNGIRIALFCNTGAELELWANVEYNDDLGPAFENLRLMIDRSDELASYATPQNYRVDFTNGSPIVTRNSGNFPESGLVGHFMGISGFTDSAEILSVTGNQATLDTNMPSTYHADSWHLETAHTFFNRPSGETGYIVAVLAAMQPETYGAPGQFGYLEANPRIYPNVAAGDPVTASAMKWSGTEDFFAGAFYYASKYQAPFGGIINKDAATNSISAFRLFDDAPIKYTDGCLGKHPIVDAAIRLQENWVVVYYKEIAS